MVNRIKLLYNKCMQIGFIGLGKMGSRMVSKLIAEGHDVIVWNRSQEPIENLKSQIPNLKVAATVQELVSSLTKPKIVWSMLPAGEVTEKMLEEIAQYVEQDDIVIDGGNAYFKDTQKRYEIFQGKG